ncbi:acyl-CoA synthetase [Streptomyces yunnanensis]|uniref:Malonyl-CoA/methylmalonyl-CoA synthetase n=1 Tax=Streptomyces yunnanensis TaxID=156453 RepID=A0A9X8N673_9ACTN|nr:acyl-CoA synthetase [Streptomyces yunnanensis]SHN13179.1 malonyl-CoA/methylmalonyl-CoA synthetase [Streptomyces yunnanensis]
MNVLFPALRDGSPAPALRFGDRALDYRQLAAVVGPLAERIGSLAPGGGPARIAVWATPTLETSVGVIAALLAGVAAVPVNPKIGERELTHIVTDSAPALVVAEPGTVLPGPLATLPRLDVEITEPAAEPAPHALPLEPGDESPALIVYTSGTTGPPKGVVLPRRALAHTLDALADTWQWTAEDVLVHALPLFHVHGLILGILGPLRRGGSVHHLGRFSPEGVTRELSAEGTMLFGVPTMYHRLALEAGENPALAKALGRARLLVSGSAALPLTDHERLTAATGRRVIERYGMTETLMNTSVRADGPDATGTVGVPLPGVYVRLVDDAGQAIETSDGETVGEIQVRGPNLFSEYLNRPDATAAAFDGGWFRTGDMAVRDASGNYRIVGRKATDLIKSGGYKIGAGEIENALLAHPGVAEAAVTGEPDEDLGERIVAWIVPATSPDPDSLPSAQELADHVAQQLAPHKRPRVVHFLEALPRNDMGKILKRDLRATTPTPGASHA